MHNKHEDRKHEEQQARAHENSKHDNINLESSSHENSKHENIKHIEHENSNYENRKLKHNQSESLTESTRPAPRNLISPIRVTHLDQRDHPTQLNQHNQSHANQSAQSDLRNPISRAMQLTGISTISPTQPNHPN
jgi:hypothetical protein